MFTSYSLEPINSCFIWKKGVCIYSYADKIKLRILSRSSLLIREGPKSNEKRPCWSDANRDFTYTEEKVI